MSAQYSRDHCKIAMAKVLQTIGWHSINSTPLEVMTDIMVKYVQQLSKLSNDYANEFGQTEANLDHLGLAFQEMGINLGELEEYVTYVNFGPGPTPAPKFPIHKESNLNFLKPGSKEVVTRPVHINEHLPPMYPLLEGADNEEEKMAIKEEISVEETSILDTQQFKKPSDISPEFRKPKKEEESGSRPTREISSVMMTTSGFLSPAREGKLPEAKAPAPPPALEPPPLVMTSAPGLGDLNVKKKVEKRKEKVGKELFKPIQEEKVVKKMPTMKDFVKMKLKMAAAKAAAISPVVPPLSPVTVPASSGVTLTPLLVPISQQEMSDLKYNPMPSPQKVMKEKMDKALAAAKAKTLKLNTTITPIPMKPHGSLLSPLPMTVHQVEKLLSEPDKKKVNIFKKISNVKEGKPKKDSRSLTPSYNIDEANDIVNKITQLSNDITIEPIHPVQMSRNSDKMEMFFNHHSPPVTPLTHGTPEIVTRSPSVQVKRKRKDPVKRVRRPKKQQQQQRHFLDTDFIVDFLERPKTPDAAHLNQLRPPQAHVGLTHLHAPAHLPFPFLANFGGPGLIPSQLSTPMFPFSQFGGLPNFGKNPYFPSVVNIPPQMEPVPLVSPKVKDAVEIKAVEVVPQVQKPSPPVPSASIMPIAGPASPQQPIQVQETSSSTSSVLPASPVAQDLTKQKLKEHKKEKKDKIKKRNKKDKEKKEKSEKKKLKELKKDEKGKVKREKKVKKKEKVTEQVEKPPEVVASPIPKMILKVNSPSSRPDTPESLKKLNIKPIIKKEEEPPAEELEREPSPGGLAKIAALVTGPPKPKSTLSPMVPPPPAVEKAIPEEPPPVAAPKTPGRPKLTPVKPKVSPKVKKVEQPFKKVDDQGNEVWICPACGQQDDGRPMIGCDGCDAWYHWVCVGIQVPPDENENWYCKPCLCRKNEDLQQSDKKRKRKRKEKKDQ